VGVLGWLVHNVCLSVLQTVLRQFTSKIYRIENLKILLDKKGLNHILTRHHPRFWDKSTKTLQSFFTKNTTIRDIEKGIGEVLKQNRNKIIKNGTKKGQYEGIVDGVKRVVGLKNGRIGQYY
jgi:hypothetical protein